MTKGSGGNEPRSTSLSRGRWRSLAGALLVVTCLSLPGPLSAQEFSASDLDRFASYVSSFRPLALQKGVSGAVFDSTLRAITPDASLRNRPRQQSEFLKPIKAYVTSAAAPARVTRGIALGKKYGPQLTVIEQRLRVPREIILAIWGIETDFGRDFGSKDVLRALLTQGFLAPDQRRWGDEVVAALLMIERGLVKRERLVGSWAGAMGHPQFLPSAYLAHAVSFAGKGTPTDIWGSIPDSLISIANFLKNSGWKAGEPWGSEVKLPAGFDHRAFHQPIAAWRSAGLTQADGGSLKGAGDAVLYHPVGAIGPALLLQPNFFVLKAYNFSDAYALSVSLLAEKIAGRPGVVGRWPDEPNPLKPDEIKNLQQRLAALGHYKGEADGRIGPILREAVHAFQVKAGITPADGYPARVVWERVR